MNHITKIYIRSQGLAKWPTGDPWVLIKWRPTTLQAGCAKRFILLVWTTSCDILPHRSQQNGNATGARVHGRFVVASEAMPRHIQLPIV